MSVIIRLQNLPLTASSVDIRSFFRGLSIPDGGVHIVGGREGDAFIAFSTDEDARQAMGLTGNKLQDSPVRLLLSSRNEMFKVIEQARQKALGILPSTTNDANGIPQQQTPGSASSTNTSASAVTNNLSNLAGSAATNFPGLNITNPFAQQQQQQQGQQTMPSPFVNPGQLSTLMAGGGTSLFQPNPSNPTVQQQQQLAAQQAAAAGINPFMFPPPNLGAAAGLNLNAIPQQMLQQMSGVGLLGTTPATGLFNANQSNQGQSPFDKPSSRLDNNSRRSGGDDGRPQRRDPRERDPPPFRNTNGSGIGDREPPFRGRGNEHNNNRNNVRNAEGVGRSRSRFNAQEEEDWGTGDGGGDHGFGGSRRGGGDERNSFRGGMRGGGDREFGMGRGFGGMRPDREEKGLGGGGPAGMDRGGRGRGMPPSGRGMSRGSSLGRPFPDRMDRSSERGGGAGAGRGMIGGRERDTGYNPNNPAITEPTTNGPLNKERERTRRSRSRSRERRRRRSRSPRPERATGDDSDRGGKTSGSETRKRGRSSRSKSRERGSRRGESDTDKSSRKLSSRRRTSSKERNDKSPRKSRGGDGNRSDNDDVLVIDTSPGASGNNNNAGPILVFDGKESRTSTEPKLSRFDAGGGGSDVEGGGSGRRKRENVDREGGGRSERDRESKSSRFDNTPSDPRERGGDRGDREKRVDKDRDYHRGRDDAPKSRFDSADGDGVGDGGYRGGGRGRDTRRFGGGAALGGDGPVEAISIFDLDLSSEFESSAIIIHNMPPTCSERDICDFFGDIGLTPVHVRILYDHNTGIKNGNVICEFETPSNARRAASNKDGSNFGRNKITVKVLPPKSHAPNLNRGPPPPFARGGGRGGLGRGLMPPSLRFGGPRPPPRFPPPSAMVESDNPFVQALNEQGLAPPIAGGGLRHRLRNPLARNNNTNIDGGVGSGRREREDSGDSYRGRMNKRLSSPSKSDSMKDAPAENSQDLSYFERPGCVVAVTNIPYSCTMDDILKYLEEHLQVSVNRDRIIRRFNEHKQPTGDARIAFDSSFEAQEAHDILTGTSLWNRAIQVSIPRQF